MRRVALSALVGVVGGLASLGSALFISFLTSGRSLPISPEFCAYYSLFGALTASVVDRLTSICTRSMEGLSPLWLGTVTLAVMYTLPVFHFTTRVLHYRGFPSSASLAGGLIAVGIYALWIVLLRIVAGRKRAWVAYAVGAPAVQIATKVNQDLFASPVDWMPLAADGGIIFAALATASLHRARRAMRIAAGLAAMAAIAALTASRAYPGPDLLPVEPSKADRTNLVFVLVDTLRADVFESVIADTEEGHRLRDALGEAAWFQAAMSAAPWTPPSVASIVTGLYPAEHGLQQPPRPDEQSTTTPLQMLSPSVRTLAEELRDRGYVTDAIMTNTLLSTTSGIARGYMRYDFLSCSIRSLPLLSALEAWGFLSCPAYEDARAVRSRFEDHLTDLEASGAPFFLWLHLMDPHEPLTEIVGLTPDPKGEKLVTVDRLYRDNVRYAARELAGMLELLRERPLWSRTLVVVTSDHGEMLPSDDRKIRLVGADGAPRIYGHGHALYEELTRIPLVIRPPGGLPEERWMSVPTSHVDLRDTLSELMDLGLPPVAPHRYSLAPWVSREAGELSPEGRTWVYISSNNLGPAQDALRTERFKLIDYPNGENPPELYDLASDPLERANIAAEQLDQLTATRAELGNARSALRQAGTTAAVPLSKETIEQLRALGYMR